MEQEYSFMIFDRWGNVVFKTNDPLAGWDGTYLSGGGVVKSDVYVWKINMMDVNRGRHEYYGHVTVLE